MASQHRLKNIKKSKLLGMNHSKARRILVNQIIYAYFSQEFGEPYCYRCGEEISGLQFHIDHKIPWIRSQMEQALYFDLSNLALSHPLCNSISRRQSRKYILKDSVVNARNANRRHQRAYHNRKKKLQSGDSHDKT